LSKPNTIHIDDIEYVRADTVRAPVRGPVRIVILQRGWVMVGRYERNGDYCTLQNAAVIRIWGTTKGLPEIANDGPTSKTILDKIDGGVEFHTLTVIATLHCREEKWSSRL
jgi:hypothetical protein